MSTEIVADKLFVGSGSEAFGAPPAEAPDNPLTHYVLHELPYDLRKLSEGDIGFEDLAAKEAGLLRAAESDVFRNTDPEVAIQTQLDLLFMLGGFLPAGKEAFAQTPPSLLGLLGYHRERFGISDRMNYDLIIDENTRRFLTTGQIRVYSDDPEAARHERDFYIGHHFSETHAKAAAFSVKSLVELPQYVDHEAILVSTLTNLRTFREYMSAYGRLPKDTFTHFRQFLSEYPDGVRNASGAFMPSVQILELGLHKPSGEYRTFLDESAPYFPAWSQPILNEQLARCLEGRNLADMIDTPELTLSDEAQQHLIDAIGELIKFRQRHMGITFNQIPGAFDMDPTKIPLAELTNMIEGNIMEQGKGRGTAGFNVRNVLVNSTIRLLQLRAKLSQGNAAPESESKGEES